jgi:hypothetical protein
MLESDKMTIISPRVEASSALQGEKPLRIK